MEPFVQAKAEQRLEQLGLTIEAAPMPTGHYASFKLVEPLLYLSGVTPKVGGKLVYQGAVGRELTKEEGYHAARQCAINLCASIRSALGSLDRVTEIVKVTGFIRAVADFEELPCVLNGASDLLVEVFGDCGIHARSAIGVAALPGGAAVEVEMIVRYAQGVEVV